VLDIELQVEMDRAHEDVCGPAIAHLLQRAYRDYGDPPADPLTAALRLPGRQIAAHSASRKPCGRQSVKPA
jgi:hypothetical protein